MSTPCEQKDNIKHIQDDLTNHKVWRKEVSDQLFTIEVGVKTGNDRMKSMLELYDEKLKKYDDHVAQGHVWHNFIVGNALALVMAGAAMIWWGSRVDTQVERLTGLHPYGTEIAPTGNKHE